MNARYPSWETCDGCPSLLWEHLHAIATCGRETVPLGVGCLMPRLAFEQPEFADRVARLDAARSAPTPGKRPLSA